MKKFLFFSLILFAFFSVTSCSDVIPEVTFPAGTTDYFKSNVVFDNNAGEKSITFTSNVSWTASVDETRDGSTWCKVSPTSGKKGEATIKISVDENTTYDDRNAVIRLKCGDVTKNIYVNQKQQDALTLTSDRFEVDVWGGFFEIEVKSNIDYEVKIADDCKDWIKQTEAPSTRALNSSTLYFFADITHEYTERVGHIDIISGDKKETVTVYQAGQGVLFLSAYEYNLDNSEHDIKLDVESNFEYSVDFPDVDWIEENLSPSRGISTHTIYLHVKENTTYDNRSAIIRVYDKNSDLYRELVINQSQKNALVLDKKEFSFDENGGTFTVTANSNVDYKVEIGDSWITKSSTHASRGLVANSYTFNVAKMTEGSTRQAKILFSDPTTGISDEVVVTQENTFYLDKTLLEMAVNETAQIAPTNKTGSKYTFTSSDESVVTVSEYGTVKKVIKAKAVGKGKATITVKTEDGKHVASCEVEVFTIESKVAVSGGTGGYTMTVTNGSSYRGYYNEFKITNNLPSSITITNIEYYYNGNKIYSSNDSFSVSGGGSKTWQIYTNSTQYSKVDCKVTFKYKDSTYTIQ